MNKKLYENEKIKIYYFSKDEEVIPDIEKAIIEGKNTIIEYFNIQSYDREIIVDVYSSIEELHFEMFGKKAEEWEVSYMEGKDKIKVVSPLNPGKVHSYEAMLKIITKSVADIILYNNFKNVPKWLDITTYVTKLNTEESTYSRPSIIRLKSDDYFNFSDCYFITKYIVETFGKDTVIEILKKPDEYNKILKLSDEELDKNIEEFYKLKNMKRNKEEQ